MTKVAAKLVISPPAVRPLLDLSERWRLRYCRYVT